MNTEKNTLETPASCRWWQVFHRIFWSKGACLFLLVAPLCWALLPFAYRHIKKTDPLIENNPIFLVFARMAVSCVLMIGLLIVLAAVLMVFRFNDKVRRFGDDCLDAVTDIRGVWRSRLWWLVGLAIFYTSARIAEMWLILKYPCRGLEKINDASFSAIQDYGYFMGLMLALPLGIVTAVGWNLLKKRLRGQPDTVKRIDRYKLGGSATTLSSVAFWISVLFLTSSSGLLFICAKEPCNVWCVHFALMTLFAGLVAILTNFAAGCKSMGKLIDEKKKTPSFAALLISSVGINVVMSFITMVLAFGLEIIVLSIDPPEAGMLSTVRELFRLYWNGKNVAGPVAAGTLPASGVGFQVALWLVVGLAASVVAPVAQLLGVSWHDREKAKLAKYGVRGSEWLVICGGFEPLFVALLTTVAVGCLGGVGFLAKCWDHDAGINSEFLLIFSVLTVAVIAIVKITEVWTEKNSVIRNALFRQIRGSSANQHDRDDSATLWDRAIKLSLLKLYDKREELVLQRVHVSQIHDFGVLNEKLSKDCRFPEPEGVGEKMYVINMVNGNNYFTTDDPFTADVLEAQAKWCEKKCGGAGAVSLLSLKRYAKKLHRTKAQWRNIKSTAQSLTPKVDGDSEDIMPFVLTATDEGTARKYVDTWNELLDMISDSVTGGKIANQVNKFICDFEPDKDEEGKRQ